MLFKTLLYFTRAGVRFHWDSEGFLFIAIYPRKQEAHGEEDEDCDGELVREEEGADHCGEHVGCGVAVLLRKEGLTYGLLKRIE